MHEAIYAKLNYYRVNKRVPNILFYGPSGSGKKTIVEDFIQTLYSNKEDVARYVMRVNCAYGKGIKFIRENLKYFAKMNIRGDLFKTIALYNVERLTCDAQSALRRCIEQFSFNTRFFMVTTDKYKLLKPILSRFSDIYVPSECNMHVQRVNGVYRFATRERAHFAELRKVVGALTQESDLAAAASELVDQAHSALDLAKYIEESSVDTCAKYAWLIYFAKIKADFRSEVLLMYMMLHAYIFRTETSFKLFM
jgi:replication-associated recombination protein RarA